ncbi:hypothetical protein MJA45_21170 [Paenibacillus aurantius]|uniref:Uncharacterized protein n=1 Tax=Paenibacillus aurantius TaxID=2918900 RepID=A0AA96LBJ5_9BACL|nr:hypothetical protein [Paenibacillus aurantius]WJH34880.1 hypothetical protein N6H14_01520 [Paenibacillus sp. CC-CFT747]WNQ10113.1 hypothetical protein MJA45_21170 [Paenibacillus aurantius]
MIGILFLLVPVTGAITYGIARGFRLSSIKTMLFGLGLIGFGNIRELDGGLLALAGFGVVLGGALWKERRPAHPADQDTTRMPEAEPPSSPSNR